MSFLVCFSFRISQPGFKGSINLGVVHQVWTQRSLREDFAFSYGYLKWERGPLQDGESMINSCSFHFFLHQTLRQPHSLSYNYSVVVATEAKHAPKTPKEKNHSLWTEELWSKECVGNPCCSFLSHYLPATWPWRLTQQWEVSSKTQTDWGPSLGFFSPQKNNKGGPLGSKDCEWESKEDRLWERETSELNPNFSW